MKQVSIDYSAHVDKFPPVHRHASVWQWARERPSTMQLLDIYYKFILFETSCCSFPKILPLINHPPFRHAVTRGPSIFVCDTILYLFNVFISPILFDLYVFIFVYFSILLNPDFLYRSPDPQIHIPFR